MNSDNNPFLWNPSPLTIGGVLVLCVVGVALLHYMTRSLYLRVIREQTVVTQPGTSAQLRPVQQWPQHDVEAQPSAVQPAPVQVLVVNPDSEVVCAVEDVRQGASGPTEKNNSGDDAKVKAPSTTA